MKETTETLISYCSDVDRVCPQPETWNELWKSLPERHQIGARWVPPLPLILAAWHHSSYLEKKMRLREQIEWADKHGKLDEVAMYLRSLPENKWHHVYD